MSIPLVSITIPTLNSGGTLESTLESIQNQSYPSWEVIVVDSYSNDDTLAIASRFGARIVRTQDKLLGARKTGFDNSKGEFVLLLDSDEILESTALERCLSVMDKFDMAVLGEQTFSPNTMVQRLFSADRNLTHLISESKQLDPVKGAMLARFYRSSILQRVFARIPKRLLRNVVAHDHAIIYFEASKIADGPAVVPNAVLSREPTDLLQLWAKNFRYGASTSHLVGSPYWGLVWRKTRFREGREGHRGESFSDVLLALKFLPYAAGFSLNSLLEIAKALKSNF